MDTVLKITQAILNVIEAVCTFLWQFVLFAQEVTLSLIEFGAKSKFLHDNWRVLMAVAVVGTHHNFIIINEEVLVLACFAAAVYLLYTNMSDSVTESLNERAEGIRKELSTFLLMKQESLNELYKSEQSLLTTTENLAIMREYCESNFLELDKDQEKALRALIADNFVQKLDAVSNASSGSTSYVHKQIATSFRETILEGYSKAGKKKTKNQKKKNLKATLAQLKSLKKA